MIGPILYGLILAGGAIVAALSAPACSPTNYGPQGTTKDYGDGGVDDTDTDTDTGSGTDVDTDTDTGDAPDAGVDPWERDGFNGFYYQCTYGSDCTIEDLDYDHSSEPEDSSYYRVDALASEPINRRFSMDIDSSDPLDSPAVTFNGGAFDFLGAVVNGEGAIEPYSMEMQEDGWYFVPSSIETTSGNMKGLLSFIDPETENYDEFNVFSGLLDYYCGVGVDAGPYADECEDVDTDPDSNEVFHPEGIMSGVVVGGALYTVASSEYDGSGSVLGFEITPAGYAVTDSLQVVIPTSGQWPSAIRYLGGNEVAVLNTEGDASASIDIVDLLDAQVVVTIPLSFASAAPLHEIPMTEDGHYAVVAGGDVPSEAILSVVDMVEHSVAGSTGLTNNGEVRDIDLLGYKAYVSLDSNETKETSGEVAIVDFDVDFEASESPIVERVIDVGYDAGAIVVHGGGSVLLVVTDRWWEEPGTADVRWSHVVALNPDDVIVDQID